MTNTVTSPRSLDEALNALAGATAETRMLAGGTDLMVELDNGRTRPDRVVDLWGVDELRGIREEDGGLRIGALTTCTELLGSALARERADILVEAADEVGAEQIKNRATLGGNLGTASPAADLNPVLFVLQATVRVASLRGERNIPVHELVTGYRHTERAPDELIHSVWLPAPHAAERRAFRKVGTRRAQSIAKVVVALALRVEAGTVRSLRAAAGSVADRTVLLPTLSKELEGGPLDAGSIQAATRAAALSDCAPIDDVRSTAAYRRAVLQRLLQELLERFRS